MRQQWSLLQPRRTITKNQPPEPKCNGDPVVDALWFTPEITNSIHEITILTELHESKQVSQNFREVIRLLEDKVFNAKERDELYGASLIRCADAFGSGDLYG